MGLKPNLSLFCCIAIDYRCIATMQFRTSLMREISSRYATAERLIALPGGRLTIVESACILADSRGVVPAAPQRHRMLLRPTA